MSHRGGDLAETQSARSGLGFARSASEEFSFLTQLGFRMVQCSDTLIRYETNRRFVRVFHGRSSYELGVEIGRWVMVDNESYEHYFPLRDVIARHVDPAEVGYHGLAALAPDRTRKFIRELAAWTRMFAVPLLTNGDREFEVLSEVNARLAENERDALRASDLRARADEAWRRRDFAAVINAYSEIEVELTGAD